MSFLFHKTIRLTYLKGNLSLFALALILILSMILAGCDPNNEVPDPPPDNGGTGSLEGMDPCGTLSVEVVPVSPPLVRSGTIRFTCTPTDEGVCSPGSCEPCWQNQGNRIVLTCICGALCDRGGYYRPPQP